MEIYQLKTNELIRLLIKNYKYTAFPLISVPGIYLILKLYGVALIQERQLKAQRVYFKISEIIH